MKRHSWVYIAFGAFLLSLVLAVASMGQAWRGKGRVKGLVTDTTGNPLEGVTVRLWHVESEAGFETKTNKKGEWTAAFIRGGQWNIDFELPGYIPRKISVALKELGQNEEIRIQLQKAPTAAPAVPPELLDKVDEGNRLFSEGKYAEALALFEKLVQDYPNARVLHFNIGNCYAQMGQFDKAIQHYEMSMEAHPNKDEVWLAIGSAYLQLRQFDKAVQALEHVSLEKIEDPNLLYDLGNAYFSVNQLDKAIPAFERAVQLKADFTDALYMLGTAYIGKGEKAKAKEVLQKYLQYDSTSERAKEVQLMLRSIKG